MNLHLEHNTFKELIEATAKDLNLPSLYIEKDYWVTYILRNLSNSIHKNTAIFKGGTSLSKAYKLIDRFSEDIDLAVITNDLGSNQIKTLIKNIEKDILDENFQEVPNHPQVSKGSQFRKTVHDYEKIDNGDFGHANENIILELNSFAQPHPYESKQINTYIYDFLVDIAPELITQYSLKPFDVNVLNYKRTFCEKISAIARASYESDENHTSLKEKIRHFYDIYFLMNETDISEFLYSDDFVDMIQKVRADDQNQFNTTNWATVHLHSTNIFTNTQKILNELRNFYHTDFNELVYAKTLPEMRDIIDKIEILGKVLLDKNL